MPVDNVALRTDLTRLIEKRLQEEAEKIGDGGKIGVEKDGVGGLPANGANNNKSNSTKANGTTNGATTTGNGTTTASKPQQATPQTLLKIYFGSYRKGLTSWNHSKIIAVDGQYLHTGGHNMWDAHYLNHSPCRDLSASYSGPVAVEGHCFANGLWRFVLRKEAGRLSMLGVTTGR